MEYRKKKERRMEGGKARLLVLKRKRIIKKETEEKNVQYIKRKGRKIEREGDNNIKKNEQYYQSLTTTS